MFLLIYYKFQAVHVGKYTSPMEHGMAWHFGTRQLTDKRTWEKLDVVSTERASVRSTAPLVGTKVDHFFSIESVHHNEEFK